MAGAVVLAAVVSASACWRADPAHAGEVSGVLLVNGVAAGLEGCRPGHEGRVFVEVDSSSGTLKFVHGEMAWSGAPLVCERLDRSWGGGMRRDGSVYFRGLLSFRCGSIGGLLALDCGGITMEEAAELERNRAMRRQSAPRD